MNDRGTMARAAGKAATQARVVWSVELGALRARCLAEPEGRYLIQVRSSKGWGDLSTTTTPTLALIRLINSETARKALDAARLGARWLAG